MAQINETKISLKMSYEEAKALKEILGSLSLPVLEKVRVSQHSEVQHHLYEILEKEIGSCGGYGSYGGYGEGSSSKNESELEYFIYSSVSSGIDTSFPKTSCCETKDGEAGVYTNARRDEAILSLIKVSKEQYDKFLEKPRYQ